MRAAENHIKDSHTPGWGRVLRFESNLNKYLWEFTNVERHARLSVPSMYPATERGTISMFLRPSIVALRSSSVCASTQGHSTGCRDSERKR